MTTDLKLTYTGTVQNGKISLPKRLRQEVVGAFDGKPIEVTFRRKRKRRSSEQNKYYWGVVIPAIIYGLIEAGNEDLQQGNESHTEAVHEFLKAKFLDNGAEVVGIEGEVIKLAPTTTACSTVEFMDYVAKIQKWAAEFLGISIPDPNEQAELFQPA